MSEFFTITCIGLLMIISPGPDFAVVTKISVSHGRVAGVGSALGIALANLCHVAINLLGIGVVIAQSIIAFTILKVLGAAYLLYIGVKGVLAKKKVAQLKQFNHLATETVEAKTETVAPSYGLKGFYNGFVTSLLNPKACLFFLSFFSVLISPDTPIHNQILYGAWLASLAMGWFILVALFFTHPLIGKKLEAGKHWIERITGGFLVLLGLRLLGSKAV